MMKKLKETRQKLNRKLRRDNHGSAIVIVIIAMAMIGILSSAILWAAYLNYMIKLTDIRNKNSFYSAETVMEQIMAGIEHEASAAISLSYQDVMKNWNADDNESNRYARFVDAYLDTLIKNLKDDTLGTGYYDKAVLESFVDTELFDRVLLDPPSPDPAAMAWNNSSCEMELVNNASLILHDIRVSYTDENDYVSIVNTDICIDVPKLVFYQNDSIDGLYEYALIGNSGIETVAGSGASTIDGSIYAGYDDVLKSGGLIVEATSSLTIKDGKEVISKKDIDVKGPTSGLIVRDVPGTGSEVYAAGLSVGRSSALSLDSRTYVADDLLIYDTGSRVTLTKEYYGYGASTDTGIDPADDVDAAKSSAIIINGTNATIDMSGITRLLLAGRAYIGQNVTRNPLVEEVLGGSSSPPVLMGESIAVKGGQIAYLVPAECIGTIDGKTKIGQNPLNGEMAASIDTYKDEYGDTFKEVDFDKSVYKLDNKTLREFGVTDMKNIRKVYAQYNSADSENKTLLYYYLVMEKDKAAEYFVQYYKFNTSKEALDNYFKRYATGGIVLGDYASENTQYTILGNSLVSSALSESGVTLLTGVQPAVPGEGDAEGTPGEGDADEGYQEVFDNEQVVDNAKEEDEVLTISAGIADAYDALTHNLTKDASTIGAGQTVFNTIIRENMLRDYLHDNGGTVWFKSSDDYVAILTSKDTYVFPNDLPSGVDKNKVRLIVAIDADADETDGIAGGNVEIHANYTGLVVAQGEITIEEAVSINRNKMELYKALNAPYSDTISQKPMDFFVKGSGALAEEVTGDAPVDAAGNLDIDLSKIVRYMNWIKK